MAENKNEKYGLFGKKVNGYWRYKFYRRINKNYVLIKRSIFNGKKMKIVSGGYAFLSPFTETKSINVAQKDIDYVPEKVEDRNGLDLVVDNVLTTKITNPINYENEHTDVEARLKNTLDKELRPFFKKYPYEYLSKSKFDLPSSPGPEYSAVNGKIYKNAHLNSEGKWVGELVPNDYADVYYENYVDTKECNERFDACLRYDLLYLRIKFDQFERAYGYKVIDYSCKTISTSEEVRKAQEAAKKSKLDYDIKMTEARGNSDSLKLEFKAYMDAIKAESPEEYAKFTKEDFMEMYRNHLLYRGKQGDIARDSASAVAGAVAGATASQMKKTR